MIWGYTLNIMLDVKDTIQNLIIIYEILQWNILSVNTTLVSHWMAIAKCKNPVFEAPH